MKSENKIGLQKDKNEVEIKIILVFKYIIMAIIVGIVVGIIDTIFGRGLIEISDFRNKNYKFLLPFLPIAGLFITWMYHKFNELSLKGKSNEEIARVLNLSLDSVKSYKKRGKQILKEKLKGLICFLSVTL